MTILGEMSTQREFLKEALKLYMVMIELYHSQIDEEDEDEDFRWTYLWGNDPRDPIIWRTLVYEVLSNKLPPWEKVRISVFEVLEEMKMVSASMIEAAADAEELSLVDKLIKLREKLLKSIEGITPCGGLSLKEIAELIER